MALNALRMLPRPSTRVTPNPSQDMTGKTWNNEVRVAMEHHVVFNSVHTTAQLQDNKNRLSYAGADLERGA